MASATVDALEARYGAIKLAQPQQQAKYADWITSGAVDAATLSEACSKLGLNLDVAGGQISYKDGLASARFGGGPGGGKLSYDLMYVRHGKTTGNTEPRVYQGYVDEPSNALNEIGLAQAEEAADKVRARLYHTSFSSKHYADHTPFSSNKHSSMSTPIVFKVVPDMC
jgi:hypothetical protein